MDRMRRWFGVVCVALAVLAPTAASAQDSVFGIPLPRVHQGPNGITITTMPGVIPVIEVPGNFGAIAPTQPAPTPAPMPWPSLPAPMPYPTAPAAPIEPPPFAVPGVEPVQPATGTGRTVGVFVGISDYPSQSDLPFCASDALRVQQAFVNAGIMSPMDTVVLTDRQATRVAVANAVERLSRQLSPGDTLVFFFSGHGNRVQDQNGDELDGQDETIVLADGAITDDELTALLGQGRHRDLVALDSCYSGGFARDVARLADSAGFYASREDQLSYVASEHQAGGYLSYYFADAVARSQGRPLSMWELQRDLANGFASSQANGRQELTTGVSQSVNHHTVLFSREREAPAQVAALPFVGQL